ncbi:hypothetical protein DFH01_26390 [Falsiroseomonas bella]|uniref:Uncharacterized protein n=1 Tax=Falsiroseomonas bella TaxID=2184016 RepID=A0A317F4T0_9PROT|nr:hypothetical protein [Falsiroseomonas bella]PWS34160.1 hypothetical protein DFH01_26390 [Falsiroseomonas bella]
MLRRIALLLPLMLAACGTPPPGPAPVTLPESAAPQGLGDPTRGAILSAAYVFARPDTIAGDPAAGAEALGRLEFLTVELATDQRWIGLYPLVVPLLQDGRAEARAAFGIPPMVPPQAAVDALLGAAAALRAGDRAGATARLGTLVGAPGVEPMLARLAAFPVLPRAAFALAQAQAGMRRMDDDGRRGRWWF